MTCDPDRPRLYPGSIRAVVPHPFGGRIVTTGFPGLEVSDGGVARFDAEACRVTVRGLHDLGARALVVLVEPDELDPAGFELLARTCGAVGLETGFFPISDYSVPAQGQMREWRKAQGIRAAHLRAGGTVAFSCRYGAGRSGLMAALCLIEGGLDADAAIAAIRSQFPQAVETRAQEAWLQARSAEMRRA